MKKPIKKYQDTGEVTTRKNLLGRTVKESYSTANLPYDSDLRASSKYTKEVFRKDGTLARKKEVSETNRERSYDQVTSKSRYDKMGNLKRTTGSVIKGAGYKKGGSIKSKTTKKK